jgi:hypothetical protein
MVDEKKLVSGETREDPQTQPLTEEELQEENAETSLDQPSDG